MFRPRRHQDAGRNRVAGRRRDATSLKEEGSALFLDLARRDLLTGRVSRLLSRQRDACQYYAENRSYPTKAPKRKSCG
jgi:hypothetical protein